MIVGFQFIFKLFGTSQTIVLLLVLMLIKVERYLLLGLLY